MFGTCFLPACQAEDVRSNLEILKNSYLSIVNSLVILDERRRKRRQQQNSDQTLTNQMASASGADNTVVQANSSNFINVKVAQNFRNSDQNKLCSYPDTYEWNIDKFCNSQTREQEFKHLFQEVRIERGRKHSVFNYSDLIIA